MTVEKIFLNYFGDMEPWKIVIIVWFALAALFTVLACCLRGRRIEFSGGGSRFGDHTGHHHAHHHNHHHDDGAAGGATMGDTGGTFGGGGGGGGGASAC